ncbi:uncharacterized protein LOC115758872 [Drosophila novamexicana]|uniref:uncharacterized protein LOC115758872 n=1 Tax=Drosophila novamexicana TaxID=47314 RepID=UPI0011E5FA87|nr:uncharacterized protein LOC115758872 [Drosophila novamexicana]XP_030555525.1 uncharacterized protein LOC115758872 [Drosophila novamexicana]
MKSHLMKQKFEAEKLSYTNTYGALELEAAVALLMLRYQYDISAVGGTSCIVAQTTPPPPPPPPAAETEKSTPKEQVRAVVNASSQPLKKRRIPPHLLRRSLTPAKATPSNVGNVTKAKLKAVPAAACNKALLKSCRNMIREFLDNQELI